MLAVTACSGNRREAEKEGQETSRPTQEIALPAAIESERPSDKVRDSIIEYATKKAVEENRFGLCETQYGTIYIIRDGALAKGCISIVKKEYREPLTLANGSYQTETTINRYYFNKSTGLMEKDKYFGFIYFGEDGEEQVPSLRLIFTAVVLYLVVVFGSLAARFYFVYDCFYINLLIFLQNILIFMAVVYGINLFLIC